MTTTLSTPTDTTTGTRSWTRPYAFASGLFYVITFVASIPAAFYFLTPVLDHPGYITGPGSDTRVLWGCLFDMVNAFAAVGSAVAVFPVVRRHNESLALGFVTSRLMEGAIVMIGVVSLLAIVTLRQDYAGAAGGEAGSLVVTGQALEAVRDWTFLLGPGLIPAFNALLFGTLLYRSRVVPRLIPTLGLISAPLLMAATLATYFGHNTQFSTASSLATLPIAAWELSIGIWMMVKGFRPTAETAVPPAVVNGAA